MVFLAVSLPVLIVLPDLDISPEPPELGSQLEIRVTARFSSPYEMERQVLSRLENALSAIRGVKGIRSVAQEGAGKVVLEFSDETRAVSRRLEVAALLRSIYPTLPEGTGYPVLEGGEAGSGVSGVTVLIYYVYGKGMQEVTCEAAEAFFGQALKAADGISDVDCSGGPAEEWHFEYDAEKLFSFGITPGDIRSSLLENYRQDFPGLADGGGGQVPVRSEVSSFSPAASGGLLLGVSGKSAIMLSDLATVVRRSAPANGYFRVNGKQVVRVEIRVYSGINSIREARRIRQQVELEAGRQQELHLELAQDHTEYLREETDKSGRRAIWSMLILLVLLVMSYRDLRMALVLVFSLAITVSLSLVGGWALGLKWHPYTLAGMGVGFGLMVDNAIVVLDSCRKGHEVRFFPALLTATLTSVAALFLVFLLPGEYRRNLEDFAIIIILGLLASVLTVKWLVPACFDILAVGRKQQHRYPLKRLRQLWKCLIAYEAVLAFWGKRKFLFASLWVVAFGLPIFLIPHRSADRGPASKVLNTTFFQQGVRPVMESLLGGSLGLFVANLRKRDLFRSPVPETLLIRAELPQHHTPEHVDTLLRPLEAMLRKWKGISGFYTVVHDGRFGEIEVRFTRDAGKTSLPQRVQSTVEDHIQAYSGVQWSILGKGASFSNNLFSAQMNSSEFVLKGYDYAELSRHAEKAAMLLGRNMRVSDIRTDLSLAWGDRPLEDWRFRLDPVKLSDYGVSAHSLTEVLRQEALPLLFNLNYGERNNPVRAEPRTRGEFDFFRLLHRPLSLPGGRTVYLRDLGQLSPLKGNSAIYRENRQYIRRMGYDYIGAYGQARAFHEETLRKIQKDMPPGFSVDNGAGSSGKGKDLTWANLFFLVPGINFFLCALLFESLRKAVLVLLSVPVSFIGIFMVFGIGHFQFDQGGMAAFVLLGGIAVNAVIFILWDLQNAVGRQTNFRSVLAKVIFRRSGAILLTVASTICGLIPFLAEGPDLPFWFALAAGATGGLLMSLVAVFGLVPVVLWRNH